MFLSKKYPYVKQTDKNDCGPACLASVLKYYGFKTSVSKLRELTKTDINGTTIFGIIKAAESLNMIAKAVKAKSLDVLKTDFPKPAIAYVIYEDGMRHYVVLYEVNEKEVILADTGKGIVKYKIDEFFKIWTGNLILMVPTSSFKPSDETNGFKRFFKLITLQKRLLVGVFFAALFICIFGIIGTFYYKLLIDDIIPNNLQKKLIYISITMIIISLF